MASRPNIVLFMPDQLRADAVGRGTPAVDALAARGTRYTSAYSQHPVCSPSRVSMLTGWYPHVRGHRTLTHLIRPDEPNLLRYLKEAGYNVAWVGQRGDTMAPGVTELSVDFYGFTVPFEFVYQPMPYGPEHHLARAFYSGRRPSPAVDFDEAAVRTAEAWLADSPSEPWCLLVALVFPHPPFEVEEPWYSMHARDDMPPPAPVPDAGPRFMTAIRERYGTDRVSPEEWAEIRATYAGMVSRVDSHLDRVMNALPDPDSTVTCFFTDHGEYLGDYGLVEKWPSGVHDCLVRNPLVISGPGFAEGAVNDDPVEMVDLMPTLLELADVEPRHTHFGRSLLSSSPRTAAYSEGGFTLAEEHLLETAGFPYDLKAAIEHEEPAAAGKATAVRTREWTYVHRLYEDDELYDRAGDPQELHNVAADHPDVVAAMRTQVLDWLVETADVIPWDADPRNPRVSRPPLVRPAPPPA